MCRCDQVYSVRLSVTVVQCQDIVLQPFHRCRKSSFPALLIDTGELDELHGLVRMSIIVGGVGSQPGHGMAVNGGHPVFLIGLHAFDHALAPLPRGPLYGQIGGGNAFFQDDVRRAREMKARGIHYLDCGTSGGVWGLERGYCLMIGGDKQAVDRLDPIFSALAPGEGTIPKTPRRETRDPRVERGYLHCGPSGAGHFVKMVHNGIEYGMMQAFAEGFEILKKASSDHIPEERRYRFDLADVAEVWRRGSVVSSWLLDLTSSALAEDPALSKYSGFVEDSGEGRWTINTAIEEAVPADVLSAALYARFRSRDREGTANKLLSAMRNAFGGHVEPKK